MSISLNINNNKMTEDSKYTCYQIENELYEIQADLNSINAYYFSYGIGFVKISSGFSFM